MNPLLVTSSWSLFTLSGIFTQIICYLKSYFRFSKMSLRMSAQPENSVGDNIDSLPTDQTVPSHNEIQMVETIFKKKLTTMQKILSGVKEFVLLLVLFIVFSLPQLDSILRKLISMTESPYILILIKGILFVIVYFLIKNLYLARKRK